MDHKILLGSTFLIGVLYLVKVLSLYEDVIRVGRPYVYSTTLIIQLYIIKSWMRIPSNNMLHYFLSVKSSDDRLFRVCKLTHIPNRRTIDRRFKVLPIGDIINAMGNRFISEKIVQNKSASVDSMMLKASGPLWHKSDIKKNILPISGIDTDAACGYSKSKGWIFGYKLHMSCSVGKLIVRLSAGVTTANVHDSQVLDDLTEPLSGLLQNILADPAYDGDGFYESCKEKKLRLICPIKVYDSTPSERIKRSGFFHSWKGHELYSQRKVTIEPMFDRFKDTFRISTLPVKGFSNVKSFVLVCVLVYQLAVYYNCVIGAENPRVVKRMLCC